MFSFLFFFSFYPCFTCLFSFIMFQLNTILFLNLAIDYICNYFLILLILILSNLVMRCTFLINFISVFSVLLYSWLLSTIHKLK